LTLLPSARCGLQTTNARNRPSTAGRRSDRDRCSLRLTLSRPPICYAEHGWLAAVIPFDARRFRVVDPDLAATLESAGAELSESEADVEVAPARVLRGGPPTAIVSLGAPLLEGRHRLLRAGRRVVGSLELRARAVQARRALVALGYPRPVTVTWDFSQPLGLPQAEERPQSAVGQFPQSALVVGSRAAVPSLYEAVVAAATATGTNGSFKTPSMGAGLLLAFDDSAVLRVAVGGARRQLEAQDSVSKTLRSQSVPAVVRERVPELVARDRLGLADWSLERRLPGKRPLPPLSEQVLSDCVDFLVALHVSSVRDYEAQARAGDEAVRLAELVPSEADAVLELAARIDRDLADVPRGFTHGDFHRGNLLLEGGRLVGVIDWDAADAHRLAFLDLLHLRVSSDRVLSGQEWGPTILRHLLPWARGGGGELGRAYWSRIGFSPSTAQLERLVAAYWLVRASYELQMWADRRKRRAWLRNNVTLVLDALLSRT